mgnify:CR=1 FL=1
MRFSRGSHGQAMVLAIACAFFPTAAQPQGVQTLGTFLWDTVKAYGEPVEANVLVQHVSSDRLVVQVAILTEATYRSGDALARYKSRRVPTESMEAWILLDDGTVLAQTPREPPKGAPPVGVGNAGAVTSFVSFGFKSPANITPVGVVVKVEANLYVFPWQRRGSGSPRY